MGNAQSQNLTEEGLNQHIAPIDHEVQGDAYRQGIHADHIFYHVVG